MQSAKDSFYVALRERLAALNPQRTVMVDGTEQPAIMVCENEVPTSAARSSDCFYLEFGALRVTNPSTSAPSVLALDCTVSYSTHGTKVDASDRGRTLAALDGELVAMAAPPVTPRRDYAQSPVAECGTNVFWTTPRFDAAETSGSDISRATHVTIFFHAEEQSA